MREIKFRCWDIVFNKMRYEQDLWDIAYNELFIHTPDQRALNLMQYTGCKDREGKEMYEGDIVTNVREEKAEIKWIEEECRFVFRVFNENEQYYHEIFKDIEQKHNVKVIGNVYENKDLLDN